MSDDLAAPAPVFKSVRDVSFWVPGIPVPKGSLKAFVRGKFARVVEDNARTKPWMSCVTHAAHAAGLRPEAGACAVGLVFYLPRPKGHFNAKGALRPSAPKYPEVKPDVDKLVRAMLDALKGVAFEDDARVVGLDPAPWKYYATERGPGADVIVRRLT